MSQLIKAKTKLRHSAIFGVVGAALAVTLASSGERSLAVEAALVLQTKIPLGNVKGRIDHFALDQARQLLYVAELGNDSVGIVDLKAGKLVRRISGLSEPQGVGYVAASDLLFVANGRDGSVRWFKGSDGSAAGKLDLGGDADNLHVDPATSRVYVGYGSGGLAAIDGMTGKKLGDVALGGHPEGFDLDPTGPSIFANVPGRKTVAVVDRTTMKVTSTWSIKESGQNFPMAVDGPGKRFATVFRGPSELAVYSAADGSKMSAVAACNDADDVFADAKRHRFYVSCGDGFLDVYDSSNPALPRVGHIATVSGARTELFVPDSEQLFLAVRAAGDEPAAVWVFKPMP